MIPHNAREGDFVEVTCKDNLYFGMIGRIKQITPSKVTVDIYGKLVDIDKEELTLRARVGSGTHDALTEQINSQETSNLDEEGYDALIDYAIDIKDFEWAKDLVHRKNQYLIDKRKVR